MAVFTCRKNLVTAWDSIEDVLEEVYGENSIKNIMKGLHYNRGVRAHKLLYESLRVIQILEYLKPHDDSILKKLLSLPIFNLLRESIVDRDGVKVRQLFKEIRLKSSDFLIDFRKFLREKSEENPTFHYFNQYCEMVEILLSSIKADREGDSDSHLISTRQMLPYFLSMNHPIYARGICLYLQDAMTFPAEVKSDLARGMHSVKRVPGVFNAVRNDIALEQTQNRSSAISGGLIGITKNEEAMQKWILLHPIKRSIHDSLIFFVV